MRETERKLNRTLERTRLRLLDMQARYYDIKHADEPEPQNSDLKSRIIWLEQEIERIRKNRDDLKRRLMNCERNL